MGGTVIQDAARDTSAYWAAPASIVSEVDAPTGAVGVGVPGPISSVYHTVAAGELWGARIVSRVERGRGTLRLRYAWYNAASAVISLVESAPVAAQWLSTHCR